MSIRASVVIGFAVAALAACSSENGASDAPVETAAPAAPTAPLSPLEAATAAAAALTPAEADSRAVECRRALDFVGRTPLPEDLAQAVAARPQPTLREAVRGLDMPTVSAAHERVVMPPVGARPPSQDYIDYLWGCVAVMERYAAERAPA